MLWYGIRIHKNHFNLLKKQKNNNLNKLSDGDLYFLYKPEAPEMFGTEILYSDMVKLKYAMKTMKHKNLSRGLD